MKVYDTVKDAVVSAYGQLRGNPLDENNHVGPLIDTHAEMYNNALTKVVAEGKIK
jgi:aldehyde dehydrogenase (NAD+)